MFISKGNVNYQDKITGKRIKVSQRVILHKNQELCNFLGFKINL